MQADAAATGRPPIVFLLAVWGERYITSFLDLGLRTLMAAGNIPALAAEFPCTFRILTTTGSDEIFSRHPMFRLLRQHCAVEFVAIDDLVSLGTHSTTLTLAYERGMRQSRESMTATYFVYLVADYLMADGSLGHLAQHIRRGVSGITTGNFQMVQETAEPIVRDLIQDPDAPLSLPPRTLLRVALDHIHPVTLASMPDGGAHTMLCNRLFWRAGDDTLIGRFYLRHMLCIRPETDRFEIGSSCDYSFIPEMCRSGRVVALGDSDEYFVMEMQPLGHEKGFILESRLTPRRLASYLSDWTTREHRQNAAAAVVFHTGEISARASEVVASSDSFVKNAERYLPVSPQPHRGHPYWNGALGAAAESRERLRRFGARARFTRPDASDRPAEATRQFQRQRRVRSVYERWVRHGLHQFPWHPSWLDSLHEAKVIASAVGGTSAGLLVADDPKPGTDWLARHAPAGWRFLMPYELETSGVDGGPFGVCVLYVGLDTLSSLPGMLRAIERHLNPGARTILSIGGEIDDAIGEQIRAHAPGYRIDELLLIRSSARTPIGVAWKHTLMRAALTVDPRRWAWAGVKLAALAGAALSTNLVRYVRPGHGRVTTAWATLRKIEESAGA